jgi:hypothetical protein
VVSHEHLPTGQESRREAMKNISAALAQFTRAVNDIGISMRQATRSFRRVAWRMRKERAEWAPWETDPDVWKGDDDFDEGPV